MNKLVHRSSLFLKRNSSTILTIGGTVGTIATAVMAVQATPKALALLEEAKKEKGEELTKQEVVKVAAPAYIPTVVVGVSTLVCIIGANVLNKRQQASLVSAYALVENSYKEYKKKALELYGKEADAHIRQEVVKDHYMEDDVPEEEDDGKELFYDEFSSRWFRSTLEEVLRAEYRMNRDLVMRGYVYLNEFYEYLDIEPVDPGYELGWSVDMLREESWQEWLDFSNTKTVMDDGLECYVVTMYQDPLPNFADYM